MKKIYTLLLLIVLFSLMMKAYSLEFKAIPNVFNQRIKRQAENDDTTDADNNASEDNDDPYKLSSCSYTHNEECGGDMENAIRLSSFPFDADWCSKGNSSHPAISDKCSSLKHITDLCLTEAPKAACMKKELIRQGCDDSSTYFAYVGKLCSTQGLMKAADALNSPCFTADVWFNNFELIEKWWRCWEQIGDIKNLRNSCNNREKYSKCLMDPVYDLCGEGFADLQSYNMQSLMDTLNTENGAVQC